MEAIRKMNKQDDKVEEETGKGKKQRRKRSMMNIAHMESIVNNCGATAASSCSDH
jgi:hypothetical protein